MRRSTAVVIAVLAFGCATYAAREGQTAWGSKKNAASPKAASGGVEERSLDAGGARRNYLLHMPKGWDGKTPLPIVISIHGSGGQASAQVELTGLNAKADSAGFIVVYPDGTGRLPGIHSWNAGSCCAYAHEKNINDVAYIGAILDDLIRQYPIDTNRIYATGHSNGAMLTQRLACEMADRIAAIAPVAGVLAVDSCRPSRPVPVLEFHGTADQCVPYKGGPGKVPGTGTFIPVATSVEGWVKRDACPAEGRESYRKGNVTCKTWGPCGGGAEVTFCTIEGGGHAWPGGATYPSARYCGGVQTHDISANDTMWDFFQRHPLKGAPAKSAAN
jgi:polyhydroxybutyrate depolymerase